MSPLRRVAFVINAQKPGAIELAGQLMELAQDSGADVSSTGEYPIPDNFLQGMDVCCVIGGDGTLLGAVPQAVSHGVPLLGVNRGSLGFLTTFTAEQAKCRFTDILSGNYCIAERNLLECRSGNTICDLGLNDVLIKEAGNSRLVSLEVYADDERVTDYLCDGLIFATPTGSTAYNLSAGGPLIHPGAHVLAMTPICPHTLSNRSIIFREGVNLVVKNPDPEQLLRVSVDGRQHPEVDASSPVVISLSDKRLRLIQSKDHSHFSVVRTKLKWTGANTRK